MIIAVRKTLPLKRGFLSAPVEIRTQIPVTKTMYSMWKHYLCAAALILFSLSIAVPVTAQPFKTSVKEIKSAKPFKILTSGKRITIQSKQNISSVIVWTAGGHRLVEQKDINATSYTFNITVPEKIFFVRVDMGDGKMYSQKIGVQ
jgi:hypothetical protein